MEENLFTPNCIRTYTGKYVNLLDPDPETICIVDIAHALSNMPRFAGHLPEFYSVAQHSVLITTMLNDSKKLEGLLHDSPEAYLMDIPKPLKDLLPEYKIIENRFYKVIATKFNIELEVPEEVKEADNLMLSEEWDYLMLQKPNPTFTAWKNREAEIVFLKHFEALKRK